MINIEKGQIWLVQIGTIGERVCEIANDDFHGHIVVANLKDGIMNYPSKDNLRKYLGESLEDAKLKNSAYFI